MTLNRSKSTFSVRLVCAEYYQTSPISSLDPVYSEFRGSEIKQVPVIRIFGSTLNGEKTCLHVHGVFPYMYVPYTGGDDRDRLAYRLAASLDAAINVSLGSAAARNQHVFKVQLISGMPFYGYHEKEHQFFKVYFYNPAMVKRAANLLQNGTVLNETLQPHEAHIPYVQQFMIDYNLHGMSTVDLKHIKHRLPSIGSSETSQDSSSSTISGLDYLPIEIARQSICKLEVDALASDILNRKEIEQELVLNPGLAAIWEEEKARRRQLGLKGGDSQLVCPSSPGRPPFRPTENDIYQRQRLAKRLLSISQNDDNTTLAQTGKMQSSYPIETEDNSNLLNASCLEHHVGSQSGKIDTGIPKHLNELGIGRLDLTSSLVSSEAQNSSQSLDCSVLDAGDAAILDILNGLANENGEESTVDEDSLLGSQRIDSKSLSNCEGIEEEEKEDENNDLNMTWLQLDSLSRSQGDDRSQKSENSELNRDKVEEESASDYLRNLSVFELDTDDDSDDDTICEDDKKIPQCDGPGDLSSEDSDIDSNVTLEREEKRICDFKSKGPASKDKVINVEVSRNQKRSYEGEEFSAISTTPVKNPRRQSSISSPKGTCQSPKRSALLNSPRSHSSRSYTPLNIIVRSPYKAAEAGSSSLLPNAVNETPRSLMKLKFCPKVINDICENGDETDDNSPKKETSDEDDNVCDITFTQYLDTQMKQNAKNVAQIDDIQDSNVARSDKKIVIVPRFNPPNVNKIKETMESYGMSLCKNESPFYGDYKDATTSHKEVAHKLLRVPTKSLIDIPRFESDLEFITGITLWRTMKVKEVYPSGAKIEKSKMRQSLTGQNKTVIIPLNPAPLPKTVKTWLRAKEYLTKKLETVETSSSVDEKKKESQRIPSTTKSVDQDHLQENRSNNSFDNHSNSSRDMSISNVDASLANALQNSNLYKDTLLSRQLGVSCGGIEGSSQADNFKIPSQNLQDIKPLTTHQYLTTLCLELHIVTRGDLLPDPQYDPIRAMFYAIHNDAPASSNVKTLDYGVLVCDPSYNGSKSSGYLKGSGVTCPVSYSKSEEDLFENFLSLINDNDPDILVGWELEFLSWGYMFQRAAIMGINLAPRVSRIPGVQRAWEIETTELNILTEIKMPGRIVLDIWRIMRHEIALVSYTFENIMYHVMHQRLSCPSFATLTRWWEYQTPKSRCMVVDHYITKVVGILKILDQLDIIGKTTEFARLYGIQFFEVFSRGSQFQVESVMLRLAKPSNYVPVSPSVQQRASMRAPESLPLIMEPESVFYSDPLIVLDFQSLYPSIIIAHNYCFSTCLGQVENIGQSVPFEFGAASLKVTKKTALKLEDKMNFSPCGVAYVKPEVRVGILSRMLTEYLETRLMVKKAMKDHSQNAHALQRALYSRQKGLKLLANVTFGYTHANFSGRMPCIEIGDSIVSKARETLERAIKLVESTKRWNARVVYGDTDSLFVLLPGRSRKQAFEIGAEIADAVTADNPKPMKLKLEKIMQPALLQTKKRYCGYMWESPDQEKPVYLAKGIETVRRDGCPAVSKILEKTLKILFDTRDVSQVKKYVLRQLDKVLRGRVSMQDLTFAKEFRGLQGYKQTACVPALELTRRLILKDPRAIPRTSERVPYVIVAGAPNQPLFQCVKSPWELIADSGLRPNVLYYTTRVIIPPLNRCLNLLGVNVTAWFEAMPHRQTINCNPGGSMGAGEPQKSTISQYFGTVACAACGLASNAGICIECTKLPNQTIVILHEKIRRMERSRFGIDAICQSCIGRVGRIECASLDCPVLYRRVQCERENHQISYTRRMIEKGNNLEL